jgi:hypothetical protein
MSSTIHLALVAYLVKETGMILSLPFCFDITDSRKQFKTTVSLEAIDESLKGYSTSLSLDLSNLRPTKHEYNWSNWRQPPKSGTYQCADTSTEVPCVREIKKEFLVETRSG